MYGQCKKRAIIKIIKKTEKILRYFNELDPKVCKITIIKKLKGIIKPKILDDVARAAKIAKIVILNKFVFLIHFVKKNKLIDKIDKKNISLPSKKELPKIFGDNK
tara:strand:- start:9 stop:323 length:315 start_codon:yes stop_codon:yes gene_type:complete